MPRKRLNKACINYHSALKYYRNTQVCCHSCWAYMQVKDYQKHMASCHEIDLLTQCAFCNGDFVWPKGKKTSEHVALHLSSCLKKLCKSQKRKVKMPVAPDAPEPHAECIKCMEFLQHGFERQLDGRTKHAEWTDFYDDVGHEPEFLTHMDVPHHVRFSKESGLGHEIHAIFHAFQHGSFFWYHTIVKAEAWPEFKTCIAMQPYVFFLPYWTLCDGKKAKDAVVSEAQRHHRHMILLVKKSRQTEFKRLWRQRVKLSDVYAKWQRQIQSPFHLMNSLFYVSSPHAICDGNPKHWDMEHSHHTSHYWIRRQMYPHAKLGMAGVFQNGYKQWFQRHVQSHKVTAWYAQVTRKRHQKMRVRIQHMNIPIRGCVVPFEKDVCVSELVVLNENQTPDAPFLYHYEPNTFWVLKEQMAELENLPFDAWCEYQRETGNRFMEALELCEYELRRGHVKTVNQVVSVLENVQSMHEDTLRAVNHQLSVVTKENTGLCERMAELEQKQVKLERELDDHKQKHEQELNDHKQKQVKQERELDIQKQKQVELERKHVDIIKTMERNHVETLNAMEGLQEQLIEVNSSLQDTMYEKVLLVIAGLENAKQRLQKGPLL